MKYSLRSLMIAVLVLPPALAGGFAMAVRLMAEPETLPPMSSDFDPRPDFVLSQEVAKARVMKENAPAP